MTDSKNIYKAKEFPFSEYGAFFAFSKAQFEESKKEGVKYVSMDGGLICPKEHAATIWKDFDDFCKKERRRELKIRGRKRTILYHLGNHESWYTGDPSEAISILSAYGISEEEVLKEFRDNIED